MYGMLQQNDTYLEKVQHGRGMIDVSINADARMRPGGKVTTSVYISEDPVDTRAPLVPKPVRVKAKPLLGNK